MKISNSNKNFIIIILFTLYLIFFRESKIKINENFNNNNNLNLLENIKKLSIYTKEINNTSKFKVNTNNNIIFKKNVKVDILNVNSENTNIFDKNFNQGIMEKNIDYIPVGTITSFNPNISLDLLQTVYNYKDLIPENWALCDGKYYLNFLYANKHNFKLTDNENLERQILDKYNIQTYKYGINSLIYIPDEYKIYFIKTPNLIGRTIFGTNLDDDILKKKYDKNTGEIFKKINPLNLPNHTHKLIDPSPSRYPNNWKKFITGNEVKQNVAESYFQDNQHHQYQLVSSNIEPNYGKTSTIGKSNQVPVQIIPKYTSLMWIIKI